MIDQILSAFGVSLEHPWLIAARRLRRRMGGIDDNLRREYLANSPEPKLHIGGGPRLINGWLNADIALLSGVVQMDATVPFPFAAATFNYIFTEHMIEHVPFDGAMRMLGECRRVLKDGGVIRVTTPNFASITALYGSDLSQTQKNYLDWFCKTFLPNAPATPIQAINAMFRMWGHQFIYDEETLSNALRTAGFRMVSRRGLMQSDHHELRNLEHVERYPEGFLEFESIALEARK